MRKLEGAGKYTFTQILGEDSTQSDVFRSVGLPMVKDVLDGKNCLLFTYGVTNAGKTYTILVCVLNDARSFGMIAVSFSPKHHDNDTFTFCNC